MKLYSFEEVAEFIGISYTHVSRKCTKMKIECAVGRHGKKFLTEKQMHDLKPTYFMDIQVPAENIPEIIRVIETYYIYESKINKI